MGSFRPQSFSSSAGGTDAAAGSGASGAGDHSGLNSLDIHNSVQAPAFAGTEAAHLSAAGSHASAAVGHAALAAIPVAGEPISPLIQLIMRMPGALGVGSSFFEWLTNLFAPGAHDLMPGFSQLGGALQAIADGGDGFIATLSSLTTDVPVFNSLGHNLFSANGLDLSALKVSPSADHFLPDPDNLGGSADPLNAQFEGRTDAAMAGPSISNPGGLHYIAGNHRIFGDHLGNPNAGNTLTSATTVPATGSMPSTPSGATFGQEVNQMPAAQAPVSISGPAVGDNGGMQLAGSAQPAFGVDAAGRFDAGNTIAQDVPSYQPTVGHDYAPSANGSPSGSEAGHSGQSVEPLRAKQLTFKDMHKTGSSAEHSVSKLDATQHARTAPATPSATGSANSSHAVQRAVPASQHAAPAVSPKIASSAAASPAIDRSAPPEAPQQNGASDSVQNADTPESAGDQTADSTAAPEQGAGEYTVERGDSLWNIAQKNLGDGNKWTEIYKLNQDSIGQNPDLIYSGAHLKLPGIGAGSQMADASHYMVQPGDNLWNIAKSHLGSATKWSELYQANAGVIGGNPSLIMPGQELTFPGVQGIAQAPVSVDPSQVAAPSSLSTLPNSGAGNGFEQQASFGSPNTGMEQQAAGGMQSQPMDMPTAPAQNINGGFEGNMSAPAQQVAPTAPTSSQLQMSPLNSHPVPGISLSASEGIPVSSSGIIQVAPVKDLVGGPGAAGAATLKSSVNSVVTSSLAPDLSFLGKRNP